MAGCVRNAETNDLEEDGGAHDESVGSPASPTLPSCLSSIFIARLHGSLARKEMDAFIPQSCGE